MKSLRPFLLLLLLAGGLIGVVLYSQARPAEVIPWRTNLSLALQEAQQANRPLLLDFSATWCGPCQEMKQTTWANATVEQALKRFVPVKIDADEHPELVRRYQVDGYPTMLLATPEGKVGRGISGYLGPDEFVRWLGQQP